jgi:hypothetical protein
MMQRLSAYEVDEFRQRQARRNLAIAPRRPSVFEEFSVIRRVNGAATRPALEVGSVLSRPVTPFDLAEQQALARIASLAAHVLIALRQRDGRYSSERQLSGLLSANGVAFTAADLAPALALLEATGRIQRAPVNGIAASAGWLPAALRYTSDGKVSNAY